VAFSGAQIQLVEKSGGDPELAAQKIIRNHPRCLDALRYMAAVSLDQKNYTKARPYIYQLLGVAPARHEVVRMAAIYAMATNDESLKNLLTAQGLKLGILTQSALK
jgi:rRNA-processing protein FCF1